MLTWWHRAEDGKVHVNSEKAYPLYLKMMGLSDAPQLTRWALECARMCFTHDLSMVLGGPLHLVISFNPHLKLANFPQGNGPMWKVVYERLPSDPLKRLGVNVG